MRNAVNRAITVLIADDHALMAEALSTSLARWFRVVGIVTELDDVDAAITTKSPQVVLLDLAFGKISALTVLPRLIERHRACQFAILTAHTEPVLADAALKLGAMAYILKTSAPSELRIAVEEAANGRTYVTPALKLPPAGRADAPASTFAIVLSDRQRSILRLLSAGHTYRSIATQLGISSKTVEYHIGMLTRRLGLRGRERLIRWATDYFREAQ